MIDPTEEHMFKCVREKFIGGLAEGIAEVVNEDGEDILATYIFDMVGLEKAMDIIDKIEHIKFRKRR
ncbi:MAG: hypothetical protein ACRDD7_08910 [Peptostreptococcaceae bacterium]